MIQIDMPMPNRCNECPFASANFYNGIVSLSCITPTGRSMYAPDLIDRRDRPDWCPLKEQETVEPIPFFTETGEESSNYVICGHCKSIKAMMAKHIKQKYCHECGFPVLWKGR